MAWTYDGKRRRYRGPDGRYLSQQQMVTLRDHFTDSMKVKAADLAQQRSEGTLPQNAWEREMRTLVKQVHIDMAALGRGGRRSMAPADWGRVGALVKQQYEYLGRFADATADLSEAQIRARAGLYVESATAAYERGRAAAFSVELPAHPGDGATACKTNCRCHWQLVETEQGIEATWTLSAAEHCEDCAANAAQWSPLLITARTDGDYKHLSTHDEQSHGRRGRGRGKPSSGAAVPAEEAPRPSAKAMLAKQHSRRVGADVQRYSEEHCEGRLASGLKTDTHRAMSLRDNEPVDVIRTTGGKVTDGIELKVMTDNKNNKLTMKRSAMERKSAWQKENGADFHTVVFDDQRVFNAKGAGKHGDEADRVIYYRRGSGSFRVGGMHRCADMAELRSLLDMPHADLPAAAKPPAGYQSFKSYLFAPSSV